MADINVDVAAIKKKKLAAIRAAFKQIDKFTKQPNTAFIMGERPIEEVKRFSSGSLMLDIALGGGLCYGRVHEVFGAESSGKSLCMLRAIASCQAQGGICAYVDQEQSFSSEWAKKNGVNVDELIFSQPDTLEDAFEVILALAESGGVDFIVVDSVAAMVPRKEMEDEVGQNNIALIARGMSVNLRKLVPIASKNNCAVAFINQIRDNVGILYGDTSTTPGGKALRFYSSLRIETRKKGSSTIKERVPGSIDAVPVGHIISCTVKKNKTAPPFRKAEFTIYYDGRKVSQTEELVNAVLALGLIPKYDAQGNISETGRTYKYSYDGEELVSKKSTLVEELDKCPKIRAHLLDMIKSGDYTTEAHTQAELMSEMGDDDFERQIQEDAQTIKNGGNLVDEIEDPSADWDNM